MLIAAASDLHMLDGNNRDDFKPYYEKFMAATAKLPADAIPVLPGDIIDVQGGEGDIANSAYYYREFWNWFAGKHGVYIVGNHDERMRTWDNQQYLPIGISFCDRIIIDGLYYTHGSEWDVFCSQKKWVGAAAMKLANLIGKNDPRTEDYFRRNNELGRHSHPSTYERQAQDFVDSFGFGMMNGLICYIKGIVLGHTHRRESIEYHRNDPRSPTRYYINCGSVAFAGDGWTLIRDGKYEGYIPL